MKNILTLLTVLITVQTFAQDPNRYKKQVSELDTKYDSIWDPTKETIVFTGSSSIRMWKDVQERFPEQQVINTGFGGSQASDLLYFADNLILRYKPKQVFIYEGDNDIQAKKKPNDVIADIQQIINLVRERYPATNIVLISAKPSISRWKLRGKYKRLNRKFKRMTKKDPLLDFADVWKPMLDGRKLQEDLFIEDGLHMNPIGYEIWFGVMKDYITN